MDWKVFYDSYYYKYVLNPYDRETFRALTRKTLTKTNKYYSNGMLVVNAKIRTLSLASGISYSKTKKCLNKLDELGLIVKGPKKSKNDRFFLGFRGKGDEKYYLAWYLAEEHKSLLESVIEKKLDKSKNIPKIKEIDPYCLNINYKHFIFDHFDNPAVLVNRQLKNNKNIAELLFGIDNIFRQSAFEAPKLD